MRGGSGNWAPRHRGLLSSVRFDPRQSTPEGNSESSHVARAAKSRRSPCGRRHRHAMPRRLNAQQPTMTTAAVELLLVVARLAEVEPAVRSPDHLLQCECVGPGGDRGGRDSGMRADGTPLRHGGLHLAGDRPGLGSLESKPVGPRDGLVQLRRDVIKNRRLLTHGRLPPMSPVDHRRRADVVGRRQRPFARGSHQKPMIPQMVVHVSDEDRVHAPRRA